MTLNSSATRISPKAWPSARRQITCATSSPPSPGPGATIPLDYALEYGTDRIEIQADAVRPGQRVVVVDDLLATGGTMAAGIQLLRKVGAVVPAAASLIELTFLEGRKRLDVPFEALVSYDS